MPTAEEEAAAKAAADKVAADAAKTAADKAAADAAAAEREKVLNKALSSLTDKEAELLKEVMEKKTANKELNQKLTEALENLKKYDGIDPDKAKKLLTDAEKAAKDAADAEKKRLEQSGEFDRVKKMMADEHAKELKAIKDAATQKDTALDTALKTINDLTIGSSFSASKFIADETVLPANVARNVFGANFDVENGSIVAYDKPRGEANRTKLVDGSGNPMSFEVALKHLVEASPDKDKLLRSNLRPGARSTTTNESVANQHTGFVPSHMTTQTETGMARMKAILDKGNAFAKKK